MNNNKNIQKACFFVVFVVVHFLLVSVLLFLVKLVVSQCLTVDFKKNTYVSGFIFGETAGTALVKEEGWCLEAFNSTFNT